MSWQCEGSSVLAPYGSTVLPAFALEALRPGFRLQRLDADAPIGVSSRYTSITEHLPWACKLLGLRTGEEYSGNINAERVYPSKGQSAPAPRQPQRAVRVPRHSRSPTTARLGSRSCARPREARSAGPGDNPSPSKFRAPRIAGVSSYCTEETPSRTRSVSAIPELRHEWRTGSSRHARAPTLIA